MKNRIQVLLLKGIALAQSVYPNIALRTFRDLESSLPSYQFVLFISVCNFCCLALWKI